MCTLCFAGCLAAWSTHQLDWQHFRILCTDQLSLSLARRDRLVSRTNFITKMKLKEDINPLLLQVFRSVVWVYSVITFLPWYFFSGAGTNLERARRIKACSISGHPAGPYRAINSQEKLVALVQPGVDTLDKMFKFAARRFPNRDCLGTREVLSEEDELQPNGKVFKKVRDLPAVLNMASEGSFCNV